LAGHAPAWLRALDRARQAAASGADVLIEAESGTGKELVARLIHRLSPRRDHPLSRSTVPRFPRPCWKANCSATPGELLPERIAAKPGKFELADRGTLLLDEVGEMPLGLQPKLLRVLQEREFDRLGDTRTVRVDLRVIATTNRSLSEMVREGKFRADLFYRLNVIPLSLPPLRERPGRHRELAEHFMRRTRAAGPRPAAERRNFSTASKRTPGRATCASWRTACAGRWRWRPPARSAVWKARVGKIESWAAGGGRGF
jgi:transcriptional regulator with GAF, ATPase, and Fis domain